MSVSNIKYSLEPVTTYILSSHDAQVYQLLYSYILTSMMKMYELPAVNYFLSVAVA